jgi:hypothetical protein
MGKLHDIGDTGMTDREIVRDRENELDSEGRMVDDLFVDCFYIAKCTSKQE